MNLHPRFLMLLCVLTVAPVGLSQAQTRKSTTEKSALAKGEKIFKDKSCASCHTTAPTAMMKAPDLTTVFTALDTTFIKVHLRFQEETAMPSIALGPKQIEDLSRYISNLHAKKFQKVRDEQADGKCPVCGALLKISDAAKDGLQSRHNDRLYYFECQSCRVAFDKNPSWHLLRWQDPTSVLED